MTVTVPLKSTATVLALLTAACMSAPAQCQDGSEWDRARAQLIASDRTNMAQAIARWQLLSSSDRFGFADYAGFLLVNPGFPLEPRVRGYAERALERESASATTIAAFFDRFPPLANVARGRYAAALAALGPARGEGRRRRRVARGFA